MLSILTARIRPAAPGSPVSGETTGPVGVGEGVTGACGPRPSRANTTATTTPATITASAASRTRAAFDRERNTLGHLPGPRAHAPSLAHPLAVVTVRSWGRWDCLRRPGSGS